MQRQFIDHNHTEFGVIHIEEGRYQTGGLAVQLVCEDGEPLATISVNLCDGVGLEDDEFFLKGYSENEVLMPAILHCGWFEKTDTIIDCGFGRVPVFRLLKVRIEESEAARKSNMLTAAKKL